MTEPKRFLLRLDPTLFEALRRWAKDDLRSINAQIEYLLTEQTRRAGRLPHQKRKLVDPEPPPLHQDTIDDQDDSIDPEAPLAPTATRD